MNNFNMRCDIWSNLMSEKYTDLYKHRFCDQENFNIVICGGENDKGNIKNDRPFLLNNLENKVYFPSFMKPNTGYKIVASGLDSYVVSNREVKSYSF